MRGARAGTIIAIAMLLRSAWDAVPRTQANWHLWSRLRDAHRAPADTTWDSYYASLIPYLPSNAPIGLRQQARAGTPAQQREYFFLQYALAPRLIQPDASEFVIVSPPSAAAALLDEGAYAPVRTFDDDFGLFRRTRP
jgi:hypothetical protein